MAKIIQICGTNGTGETTLVKNLLASDKYVRNYIEVNKNRQEWWFNGEIAVIGKYNSNNCCGCDADGYTTVQLIQTIWQIILNYRPKTIIFEDVIKGGLFTFKKQVNDLALQFGYNYAVIALFASLQELSQRVIERSGNKNVNIENIRSKGRQVIKSTQKVEKIGASVYFLDTSKNNAGKCLMFLTEVINGRI